MTAIAVVAVLFLIWLNWRYWADYLALSPEDRAKFREQERYEMQQW